MDKKIVQLKNVEIMWPFLMEKSEMSGKYEVQLVNLDKQQVGMLEAAGLTVRDSKKEKKNEDKGMWITAKSGWSPFPGNVFDGRDPNLPKGTLLPEDEVKAIGNGTIAHVEVGTYGWGKYAKTGNELSCGLNKLKIVKLVAKGGGDPFDDDKDPF
tara:strand:- start:120 stop:584 length:465 start_codon:yes stop_codon:yes gene_type:complete